MAIIDVTQAKVQLGIGPSDETYDGELALYVAAASRATESAKGLVIDPQPFVDTPTVGRAAAFLLAHSPVVAITAVASQDGSRTWAPDVLSVDATSGLVTPSTDVSGPLRVAYTAGMDPIPENYQLAALMILQHLWESRRGAMGVQMSGADDYMPGPGWAIPRRALELLGLSMPGVA